MGNSDKANDYVNSFQDWRGDLLRKLQAIINETAPDLTEDYKWGVPVWTHNGLVCAVSAFKDHVKINFFKGAYLPDQSIFNSGLESKEHRSINFLKEDAIDKTSIQSAVKAAIEYNK